MKFDVPSRALAKAWQAAQIAAADEEGRSILHRSALVEVFWDHGLRLISTDSYILVRAWVSLDPEGGYLEPPVDEEPDEVFVVSDPDHRGLGLLKYIQKLYRKELDETAVPMVTISKRRAVPDDQGVFEGLEAEALHIDWPEHEEVILPILEGEFPVWRHLVNDKMTEATDTISFYATHPRRSGEARRALQGPIDRLDVEREAGRDRLRSRTVVGSSHAGPFR
jgi:hypothetical protein